MNKTWRALGLMTGTSMDGVDAAVIETDGLTVTRIGAHAEGFTDEDRAVLLNAVEAARAWAFDGPEPNVFARAEALITRACADAATDLMAQVGRVDVIGFHGQTVLHHAPAPGCRGQTRQLADAQALAQRTGIDVVYDFRAADMAAGGQGAPLAPIYHAALLAALALPTPLCVLNIGGVANLTWWDGGDDLLGFDTGPGNGPIDSLVEARTGAPFDKNGALARAGRVDETVLSALMGHAYFSAPAPKSLDRFAFDTSGVDALSLEDAAATLTAFCIQAVARGLALTPRPPKALIVAGGGARNGAIMAGLRTALPCGVLSATDIGWPDDTLEAELMAFLAVRHLRGLPLTFPTTTGAPGPTRGGVLAPAPTR